MPDSGLRAATGTVLEARAGGDTVRYLPLLVAMILLIGASPFLAVSGAGRLLNQLLGSGVLLAAVFALSRSPRLLALGAALVLPSLALRWSAFARDSTGLMAAGLVIEAGLMLYVSGTVLASVLRQRNVTSDTIVGSICVYVLLGVAFAHLYGVLQALEPAAFGGALTGRPTAVEALAADLSTLLYFSFVTLTTLGYGDIVPTSAGTRGLTALEAIVGQLYIAILVARLVGLHVARGADAD